jgi:hypothetical protein
MYYAAGVLTRHYYGTVWHSVLHTLNYVILTIIAQLSTILS